MIGLRRLTASVAVTALLFAACSGGASSPAAESSAPSADAGAGATAAPIPGGLLDKVLKAGKLVVSTESNYAPQSFLQPDGTFVGFDIDVATEIAKRLGVKVEFVTPGWDTITAGSWSGRWDISIGSMTITKRREQVLAFTHPYYYTPAQMTATTKSGITTIDALAGKTICAAADTTYTDWLQGQLDSVSLGPVATPPANVTLKTFGTDQECAQAITAGQNVGEGFISSSTTIDAAIENGTPIVKVGEPVFVEQLAGSTDLSGPDPTDFVAAVSKIIDDMHADGTLTKFSNTWFKADLTNPPAGS